MLHVAFAVSLAEATPHLVVQNPIHDFGELSNTQKVVHQFILKNDGTEPLEILKIYSSCGCTIADMPERVLAPGEKGYVEATFDLRGRTGVQEKKATIHSNDPENPTFDLMFTGTALQTLTISPRVIALGHIAPESDSQTHNLSLSAPEAFAMTHIEVDGSDIQLKYDFPLGKMDTNFTVVVTSNPFQWVGRIKHIITIHTTLNEYPILEIPVFAYVGQNPY